MTVELVSQDLLFFVLISFIFKSWDTDMEFKMTKEQKNLAQQILDLAYLSNFSDESILQEVKR